MSDSAVHGRAAVQGLLEEGNTRRKTDSTDANATSSRSHAVRQLPEVMAAAAVCQAVDICLFCRTVSAFTSLAAMFVSALPDWSG